MKKILCLLILLISLFACSNAEKEEVILDLVEYSSLEELNNAVGTNIVSLESDDISYERYEVITGSIAQYVFTINNEEWCIRGAKNLESDISGLYYDDIEFKKDITSFYYNDEVYAMRFFDGEYQYVISLKLPEEEVATSYFDKTCNEFKTKITGIKSGYEIEIIEEGNNVINRTTYYNTDNTVTISDVIYEFSDDKMVSIKNAIVFVTEKAAKEYYDLLVQNNGTNDSLILDGKTIISDKSENLSSYDGYTKESFIKQLKDSLQK